MSRPLRGKSAEYLKRSLQRENLQRPRTSLHSGRQWRIRRRRNPMLVMESNQVGRSVLQVRMVLDLVYGGDDFGGL